MRPPCQSCWELLTFFVIFFSDGRFVGVISDHQKKKVKNLEYLRMWLWLSLIVGWLLVVVVVVVVVVVAGGGGGVVVLVVAVAASPTPVASEGLLGMWWLLVVVVVAASPMPVVSDGLAWDPLLLVELKELKPCWCPLFLEGRSNPKHTAGRRNPAPIGFWK